MKTEDGERQKLPRTNKQMKTLNPYWGYTHEAEVTSENSDLFFEFEVCHMRCRTHSSRTLMGRLDQVWDWDLIGKDDFLGKCPWRVPLGEVSASEGLTYDLWLMLSGAPNIVSGELRVVIVVMPLDTEAPWDPEVELQRIAKQKHEFDRHGVPVPGSHRREYLSWSSYLACREMRQLARWGERVSLTTPLQQTRRFLELIGITDLVWYGIPRARRGEM